MNDISSPGVVKIPLTNNRFAVVDAVDAERVLAFKWRVMKSDRTYYAARTVRVNGRKTTVYLHRFIIDAPVGVKVDHKDRDGLNCRGSNLRLATDTQNSANKTKSWGACRFKGVERQGNRWRARLWHGGKAITLGWFDTEEDAARAYDHGAIEHFGAFAVLNFPEAI